MQRVPGTRARFVWWQRADATDDAKNARRARAAKAQLGHAAQRCCCSKQRRGTLRAPCVRCALMPTRRPWVGDEYVVVAARMMIVRCHHRCVFAHARVLRRRAAARRACAVPCADRLLSPRVCARLVMPRARTAATTLRNDGGSHIVARAPSFRGSSRRDATAHERHLSAGPPCAPERTSDGGQHCSRAVGAEMMILTSQERARIIPRASAALPVRLFSCRRRPCAAGAHA
jgi:hypothetical protein